MARTITLTGGRTVLAEKHNYRYRLYYQNRYVGSWFPRAKTWGWMDGERRMHGDARNLREAAAATVLALELREQVTDIYAIN